MKWNYCVSAKVIGKANLNCIWDDVDNEDDEEEDTVYSIKYTIYDSMFIVALWMPHDTSQCIVTEGDKTMLLLIFNIIDY